ncbi:host specificity factor TipJ family phage tail protein [Proteus mirabilis]|uniref:host specificity factor TipJ family phage tail protein n=1 Tax=Proteus mirabilis TaxID=584 RepID=UPI00234BFBB5|nr:host specificity factor TipJ family phage tail protein [Proteus mirabilis]MDC5897918.1 host specificity factor TipJ family phage tail protein [Proteus mirabilis]MDC5901394.1 host specificity factor TipJ family phage tail protein [Proteus mirabilis]MDC5919050.1 host specificity factor TipJ family phage tail protein [Proteus mirabilis]MDC5929574.1 host specificity factor TipJ family phage tail protein [Proteus mirabilis]MDC5936607.1 host specificity factor TipJ family phage tail protein [Prot
MPIIEIQRVAGVPKERVEIKAGSLFFDWLNGQNFHHDVDIYVNGVKLNDDDRLDFIISEFHYIQIFDQPKGIIGDILNPVFKFVSKIFSFLAPKAPSFSAADVNAKESPNNRLTGQTNIARTYQARPEIHGQVRAFPDLIQQSMFEYIDNKKMVTEWMNFGIGYYTIENVKYSESELIALDGASYQIFQPGEVIPQIFEGFEFPDVDGQEIPGPNESDEIPQYQATANNVISGEIKGGEAAIKIEKQDDFRYFMDIVKPRSVSLVVNVTYDTPQGSVTKDIKVDAYLSDAKESDDGAIISPKYYYEFFFTNLTGGDLSTLPPNAIVNTSKFILYDNQFLTVGPFFSPLDGGELWVHLNAQLGDGDWASARIEFWKIDDNNNEISGTREAFDRGFPSAPKTKTYYLTEKFKPLAGYGRYALQLTRLENSNDHSILKLEEVFIVRERINEVHEEDTLVKVTVRATEAPTGARERKYNALATRHVISYDMNSRSVDYTLRPSRSFADAVAHTWLVTAGQPESTIDLYGLYSIYESLPDKRLGYFDYTFDDEDVSLGQRIETICNVARVISFWDNGVLTFTREEEKQYPSGTFNRANTTGNGFSLSYDMTMPSGNDGVEIEYVNPKTNKKTYLKYRIEDNKIVNKPAKNPNKITIHGCRNEYQATDRALLEIDRLIHQRMSISGQTLADGDYVYPGDLIIVADTYDKNQQAGYIVERIGNQFSTNEKVVFDGEMFVCITDHLGNTTEMFKATPRSDTAYGFIADIPNIQLNIYDGMSVQSPSRYVISNIVEMDSMRWIVSDKKPNADGTFSITASEYFSAKKDYNV